MSKPIGEKCICGADSWEIAATLVKCDACSRVWGRVNGIWKLDCTSCPHTRFQKSPKGDTAVCVDCDEKLTVAEMETDGGKCIVIESPAHRVGDTLVARRLVKVPKPAPFIVLNFHPQEG